MMTPGASTPNVHTPPSQYLPGYLLGEVTPHGRTQSPLRWSSSHVPQSPLTVPQRPQGAKVSPPNMVTPPPQRSEILRSKDRSAAPPVQSLFEDPGSTSKIDTSARQTPFSSFSQQHPTSVSRSTPDTEMMQLGSPPHTSCNVSQLNTSAAANQSFQHLSKIATSPTQRDPFYTQGESLLIDDQLDETWVTVFGFTSAAASYILDQFSQYGNILQHVISPEGNWMHIHYQSKLQAKKALSKNGKVFGDSIMLGVTPCIDKTVMEANKENANTSHILADSRNLFHSTPILSKTLPHSLIRHTPGTPISSTGVRTMATPRNLQKKTLNENEVFQTARIPQKSNDFFSKAMEYVFGW